MKKYKELLSDMDIKYVQVKTWDQILGHGTTPIIEALRGELVLGKGEEEPDASFGVADIGKEFGSDSGKKWDFSFIKNMSDALSKIMGNGVAGALASVTMLGMTLFFLQQWFVTLIVALLFAKVVDASAGTSGYGLLAPLKGIFRSSGDRKKFNSLANKKNFESIKKQLMMYMKGLDSQQQLYLKYEITKLDNAVRSKNINAALLAMRKIDKFLEDTFSGSSTADLFSSDSGGKEMTSSDFDKIFASARGM